ncbi:NUDIX domain-containing protein [Candidatus Pacearchaeota archaeon]|nr:NUDIX domain-containing protein [Candidatus Pacearchaeota archaeon]
MGYSGAILKNRKGKILFQLRDENGKNPNKWGIFGGGIKKNETPNKALLREVKEELSIQISESDIIKHHKIPFINYHIFEIYLRSNPKKSDLKEGKGMKFMTKEGFLKTKNALLRVKIFLKIFNIH